MVFKCLLFQLVHSKSSPKMRFSVVDNALRLGYRSFDTAQVYQNEHYLGSALQTFFPKYELSREDVFITSKLGPKNHGSLKCNKPGTQSLKVDDARNCRLRLESWKEMESLCKEGLLKSIGVSNFTIEHLSQLLQHCSIKPVLVQSKCLPHLTQKDLRQACKNNGITFQAYSSQGTAQAHNKLLKDEKVAEVARGCGRSASQVLLRWTLHQNIGQQ